MTKENLAATAQRARAGDQEAFTDLFMALHKPVLNYVYRTVGDRQVAEDVTQDAFIRAHARIDQLGPPWDFKSWVFRIASNLAIDHLRRAKRFVDVEEPMELSGPPTTRRPAERGVQRHESGEDIKRTLAMMQARYRQALVLKEINDLSYKEISGALECSYDNARQLVHRARLHFRELHGIRLLAQSGASSCMALGNLLSAFQDGELGEEEQEAVKAHLAVCEHCQETEEDLKRVAGIFAFLPPLMPSDVWVGETIRQIRSQSAPGGAGGSQEPGSQPGPGGGSQTAVKSASWSKWLLGALAGLVGAGGLVVAAGFALGFIGSGGNGPPTPNASSVEGTVAAVMAQTEAVGTHPQATEQVEESQDADELNDTPAVPVTVASSTPTPSPTLGPPFAIASVNSNCRGGPGSIYDVLGYLMAGDRTRIRGKDHPTNWWVVDQMDGSGTCWVANNLTDEEGDLSQVPVVLAPPTPTPADTTPPTVQVSYSPTGTSKPDEADPVTFTATASDDRQIEGIEIYVQSPRDKTLQLVQTCVGKIQCGFVGGPYPPGTVYYQAKAYDQAGNSAQTTVHSLRIHIVVK